MFSKNLWLKEKGTSADKGKICTESDEKSVAGRFYTGERGTSSRQFG